MYQGLIGTIDFRGGGLDMNDKVCKFYESIFAGGEYGDYEDRCILGNKKCDSCPDKFIEESK